MTILNESQKDRDIELAQILNIPLKNIEKISLATSDAIQVYDSHKELKPDEYIELYKTYDYLNLVAYLKTLMNRSAKSRHKELFKLLRETKAKVCLDYGSGVGTHAIALAENDNHVTLYDVAGSVLLHFAIHRMIHRHLNCNVLVHTDILQPEHYDVIICTDVLEHVAHPVYELNRIKNTLKKDGLLHLLVSTMIKPSSGHFKESIIEWKEQGIPFMDKYFIKEGQTIYRKK